jgi:pyruvate dehydrogenase E2 component (dihydrolipoamide acetyltransferase)
VPAIDFSQFGDIESVKLSKIQKLTANNMQRNWLNVPHVTQFDDADITELEDFRKSLKAESEKRGIRVTPVAFLVKAIAASLYANPEFNRSLVGDGEHYIQKHYINIGMAVDTPRGLVVPVIKDANEKGIWEISEDIMALASLARDGKLKPADMQGGCFTLSSLGAIGGTGFTPIVNSPEVGILGVSKSQIKPVWNGSDFAPRLMLPLCLSYDHRVINGGDAGRFMTHLVKLLGDIRYLAL